MKKMCLLQELFNKRKKKPKIQVRIDNPERQATWLIYTERGQTEG